MVGATWRMVAGVNEHVLDNGDATKMTEAHTARRRRCRFGCAGHRWGQLDRLSPLPWLTLPSLSLDQINKQPKVVWDGGISGYS